MADKMAEQILCFPRSLFDELGPFQGISADVDRYFPAVVQPKNTTYVVRRDAEDDPSMKQVIPYVLFVYEQRILSYLRGKGGSEARLHALRSVGIGGHIAVEDRTLFASPDDPMGYYDAMRREVGEEVHIDCSNLDAPCVALINDDSNAVGSVHFGVVHIIKLSSPDVAKRESFIREAALVDIASAVRDVSQYETWSQLCLAHIDALLARSS